ncbi:MAG: sugar ABC transporter permease [Clostridia bacterium]|nr:sugar ABC transporter permease [Clostridia bacterium]
MQEKQTLGTVVSVTKQWWLKINTKSFRKNALDGAVFPHVVKVRYEVDGKEYIKSKWIGAGLPCPVKGEEIVLFYDEKKPKKIRIER